MKKLPTNPSDPNTQPPTDCIFTVLTDNPPKHGRRHPAQYKPGQSGNPKGSLNKSILEGRAVLEANTTRLLAKAVEFAMAGSQSALKLCVQRLVPILQERPVAVSLPADSTQEDLLAAHAKLVKSLATGEITPREAEVVSNILEAHRRTWESADLSRELTRVENRLDNPRKNKIEWVDGNPEGN